MTTIADFVERCRAYQARRGISGSYLSRLLFDDGKVLDALASGSDITIRRFARAEVLLGEFERALVKAPDDARAPAAA